MNGSFKTKSRDTHFWVVILFIQALLTSCTALNSEPNSLSSSTPLADSNDLASDRQGPTMLMNYSREKNIKNPIASFMYFVPLIAPTLVDSVSSVNNDQQVSVLSYELKTDSNSFHLTCEFEIAGTGFHMNTFDPAGMIAAQKDEAEKEETLTNLLDYIRFDGEGYGVIEVKGRIADAVHTVSEVDLQFNARGHKSPVTIGLYDIKLKNGEYRYENRSNKIVARVNTLAFKNTPEKPRMGIKVASISDSAESEGFFSSLKGAIANLFIKPPKVSKLGNATMIEFGEALVQKKTSFTFPEAQNIKEIKKVDTPPEP
jgi:hypothetical protein